jgi:DNA-binding Lrp family transcriptional regulator
MTRDGVIRRTAAVLDGPSIGRPLLAFIHIDTDSWGAAAGFGAFADIPEVEEAHTVAGDACLLLKVRCADTASLEALLGKLSEFGAIKSTRTYIALSSYVERGPQP